ncbi:alpha/beta fold hydrolase [Qipengyuania sp.]|uniref:alpha/beta fold hydrolase n=1 Tax=Qipengyuania sp. TaxID=2004515 RepID=UPI003AF86789
MFTTLFLPDATAEEIDWFNELQRLSTSPENAVRLQRAFAEIDVRDMLAKVVVLTLLLHPRDDCVVPFALGRELAATISGAQFVPLESRNHRVLENEPAWRRAIDCIREFLA